MMLVHQKDVVAIPLLEAMVTKSERPLARVHALCTLDCLGNLKDELLGQALADKHPGVRKHAIRIAEGFVNKTFVIVNLLKLTGDPDLMVRMQLAYTLGEWEDVNAAMTAKVGKAPV